MIDRIIDFCLGTRKRRIFTSILGSIGMMSYYVTDYLHTEATQYIHSPSGAKINHERYCDVREDILYNCEPCFNPDNTFNSREVTMFIYSRAAEFYTGENPLIISVYANQKDLSIELYDDMNKNSIIDGGDHKLIENFIFSNDSPDTILEEDLKN